MRADRLLTLLLLLQNRGRMTAGELAAELEVSVRTVYRDVEALSAAGVPVYADRGPAGGYRLTEGYRTRLTGLTDGEAQSLVLAGLPGAAAELGLGAQLAAAQLKLDAALPAGLGEQARRTRERFHLDATAWFRDADPVPLLTTVAAAVWGSRVLRVRYRRWRGEVERELQPLGLVLKAGIWYLAARPAGADGAGDESSSVRTYRVSRLVECLPLPETFERPAGFDLAAHWRATTERMTEWSRSQLAELLVDATVLALLPARFGTAGQEAVEGARGPDGRGRFAVRLAVEAVPVAVGDLLRLGPGAEVTGPPELRAAVASAAGELAAVYRG
ncbi:MULTISPECIES: helix-turn-helix transcriptional regulator [Streptomycetaceae]|uniref:Helix-turn-helix type 11 domain-containing protein n=1 Tax=Streptantibioticus cattleyicolor (strain ATCC 35852 / DSM 46488 / JCM 4925 / NBRC 14057 / NRRL 8057) TaxID=1003195 RepID=F8JU46_STREN|nr:MULTISPECIES: WYL domain-containing protein [Streptomycetaceae]AEW93057.1 helix-turn-helix type 11 domain-containing protein [Streptantibioticus cattleyicolor NRRL 8057 = DSM 46488]MYS57791.1 WYL domain-containing protein [Streptomyces sp. SID5468]CCB73416.1 conserved protein of unknown function [Streptantibioticus cattleyicolor NRRL 8057 = DSM 46488]